MILSEIVIPINTIIICGLLSLACVFAMIIVICREIRRFRRWDTPDCPSNIQKDVWKALIKILREIKQGKYGTLDQFNPQLLLTIDHMEDGTPIVVFQGGLAMLASIAPFGKVCPRCHDKLIWFQDDHTGPDQVGWACPNLECNYDISVDQLLCKG